MTATPAQRWTALVLLTLIYIFNYADRFLISGLVEPIRAEFGLGDGMVGLLMGPAFAVLYTVLGIPIARLADRQSRIAIICIGCFVWSVFTALTGMADGPVTMALARVGVGVGEAAFVAPAYSLLSDLFKPERRALAFAILGIATFLGQIAGYAVGPAIAEQSDWRTAFYVMAAPGIALAVIAWFAIPEPERGTPPPKIREPLAPLAKRLFATPAFLLAMIGMGLGVLSGVAFGMWGPALFARSYALSMGEASTAFALYFGMAGLIGMLAFGALATRLSARSMKAPLAMAGGALFAATTFIMLVAWMPSFELAKILAIPSGLLGGGWSVGVMAGLQYLLPDRIRATGTALFVMFTTMIGFVVGPWAAGAVSEALGNDLQLGLSIVMPFGFLGALLLLAAAWRLETSRAALAEPHSGM